jgi:predicted secreted protein
MKHALLFLAAIALPAFAAETAKPAGTLIDFRTDIQKSVPNDLGRATAYAEMTGADPAEVSRKVKAAIAEGFAFAKSQPGVQVKSGNTHTWPAYAKNSRTIESWRMRSEITLESRDAAALSTTIGKLQTTLAVGSIQFSPAPETRRKAEDEASLEAIEAFRIQAGRLAGALQKPYRIRQMNINGSNQFPQPYPMARGAMLMAAEAAPMPTEAGESTVTVSINGQIELLD